MTDPALTTQPQGRAARPGSAASSTTGTLDAADLADLARDLHLQESPQQVMDRIVTSAVALVEGVEHVTISLVKGGTVTSAAATSTTASDFDALQAQLGQGPCMDAMLKEAVVVVDDLATEERWPDLARQAPAELGVRSMLCFQLFVHDNALGGLNLLASTPGAFDDRSRTIGEVFAAHAAVALAAAQKLDNLSAALASRDVIGQAKGILMERYKLTPAQAFALLAKASQDRNVKLHVVADQLTRSGSLQN